MCIVLAYFRIIIGVTRFDKTLFLGQSRKYGENVSKRGKGMLKNINLWILSK